MLLKEISQIEDVHKNDFILDGHADKTYGEYIEKAVEQIKYFLSKKKFYNGETSLKIAENKKLASLSNITSSQSIDATLEEVRSLYLENAISFHHKDYVAHLNCPLVLPAIVGELIASTVNTAVETWDQSTSATFMEQEVIRWICNEFRFPSNSSDGAFTSGGTQSNFMALLIARDNYAFTHFGINLKQNGWSKEVSKFRIFCSEKAHFSIKKNAALLGMGYDAVIPVPVDGKMKMDPNELALAIEKTKQEGNIPIAVVATVGTTDYGSFDPLKPISKIAKENDMWFHVDGAYGGCYVLTETHKHLFEDVELADSVTIDFHKTLFQPVCCSAFLAKDKKHFQYVSYYADYLNPLEDKDIERPNLIEKSIQTTKRFDGLKVWMTLKTMGTKTIASYLEYVHFLAKDIYKVINNDLSFETVHVPELSTVVFRYKANGIEDNKIHDTINLYIKNSLFKEGKISVASTKLDNKIYLKFTLLNPKSTIENLLKVLDIIKLRGEEYKINN